MRLILAGWILVLIGGYVVFTERYSLAFNVQAGCYSKDVACKDLAQE